MRSDALETGADRGMRAYFTDGRPVTTRAKRNCVRATAPANVLAFVSAMGNQGWQATCTNVEIDGPTISDWFPVEMAPKGRGFRHWHGPVVRRSIAVDNPKNFKKVVSQLNSLSTLRAGRTVETGAPVSMSQCANSGHSRWRPIRLSA
jgi:hypothetical protein